MSILDRFRRNKTRGVRRDFHADRDLHHPTKEIAYDPRRAAPVPQPVRPSNPQPVHPHPPAATVVTPVNPPLPPNPAPAYVEPASPANLDSEKTVQRDVRGIFKNRVVGVLIAVEGECEGQVFALRDGENVIGRTKDCPVQIPSRFISRPHATVIHRDGMFAIRSLTDDHPTLVNGNRIEGTLQLADGASIEVGQTTLLLRSVQ